jgi:hypothetical protein
METSFLSAGLKYQDRPVSTKSNNDGPMSYKELPDAMCEYMAPDMAKKKPA